MRLVALCLLCCCSTTKLVWKKADSTHDDFLADKWECTRDSRTTWVATGGALSRARARGDAEEESSRLFTMCMEAHGWRMVEKPQDVASR